MVAKINEKALEETRKEVVTSASVDFSGLSVDFVRNFTRRIIEIYLKNCEKIETEEAVERERKEKIRQTEREREKDVGWFPGDCCD